MPLTTILVQTPTCGARRSYQEVAVPPSHTVTCRYQEATVPATVAWRTALMSWDVQKKERSSSTITAAWLERSDVYETAATCAHVAGVEARARYSRYCRVMAGVEARARYSRYCRVTAGVEARVRTRRVRARRSGWRVCAIWCGLWVWAMGVGYGVWAVGWAMGCGLWGVHKLSLGARIV